ncbi:hypothetical protein KSP39_PZI002914 [Platanthera zijinensis]|uniref:Uncharacterized protein n=1 Tax=Platanthera zijinensis TaxID=2320716 RepID=A0AAP0BYF5_9ASPA
MSSLAFQLIQPTVQRTSSPPSPPTNSNPSHPNSSKGKNISRPVSLPELLAHADDSATLEGVTEKVELIFKLLKKHNATGKEDGGRMPRSLAEILGILDDVRSRIELCSQLSGRRNAELRRCKTDILRGNAPTSPTSICYPAEENQKLRRELAASMAARKSLESMFAGLGREKEMIAGELACKVQELRCAEEVAADLCAENKMLSDKVRACAAEHRWCGGDGSGAGREEAVVREMQGRNRELEEQLLGSLERYKKAKKGLKEAEKETARVVEAAAAAAKWLRWVREKGRPAVTDKEILELEEVWEKLAKG